MQPPTPSHLGTLARKTDDWFRRASAALLNQIPCRAGCCHCCIGLFSVTPFDVHVLQEGLRQLPIEQRESNEGRAVEQIRALETAYPRLKPSASIGGWSDEEIDQAVTAFHYASYTPLRD